ncbi:RagB/SusD family nutrient uptake outer membrane protein [Elizabethkingia anophelis]|uniref:RagB/SusD family nutrient uptake outer membrane protein n=1 Tax=Elizabethkingia anophelis TaxID=1117645 RepID=UPI000D042AFC|nr:RagB/SusD family nutrient uptake outer membrane protein [Elizabethkingia anophelis]MCL1689429.1 RagB/SusD family nutrient uptake outer membrane protein [Elizabethkingia anophelis]MDV4009439.1 RagB/SusD family nutrient uptake outer membrane protein [Elizabethkingia anophelis]MYY46371.1 RagB/SusD family nutrient uptake outer membrane protein [Elizabethkingia anophelis]PRQ84113.1 RagB/SusD family nutrient uptake outer membrane protein [Elizabethkingia anophelis]PRQ85013.1 RagB/SusD family nutr
MEKQKIICDMRDTFNNGIYYNTHSNKEYCARSLDMSSDQTKRPSFRKITVVLIFLLMGTNSCEKFLDIDEPKNQISQLVVFKDKNLALSALSDVYTNLRANTLLNGGLYGINVLLGCYTDELTSVTNQPLDFRKFYELGVQSDTSVIDTMWINAYKQIYAVNNIIEGLEKSSAYIDEATIKQLTGEAYFIRALLHFYLSNLFGDIPYVDSTDYIINKNISKISVSKIYALATSDLKKAEENLSFNYPSTGRTRVNKSAAQLLLARIYLYAKDFANARDYALKATSNSNYIMEPDLDKAFLKDSKSAVWQFMPVEVGVNTLEGQYFIIPALPPSNVVLSDVFINSFIVGDKRKTQWTKEISNAVMHYTYPFKYKQNTKTASSQEYSVVLRIEEAFLILAEANNETGNTAEALVYLNKTRVRAGLPPFNSSSQADIRAAIMDERRHELFTEMGHRFFDLKRTGTLDSYMTGIKPLWKPGMKELPLPERELLANPNLKPQNNGY